jgi:hypothetical protein
MSELEIEHQLVVETVNSYSSNPPSLGQDSGAPDEGDVEGESSKKLGAADISGGTDSGPHDSTVSGDIHPRIVEALSLVPYSALYGILWPIIINQASYDTRRILRDVSEYFKKLCHPHRRSDRAKKVC